MTSALIAVTVAVSLHSLWVRRDTWWSRWEIGITTGIALETVALVLMSPWAATNLGPGLHQLTRIWNIQQLTGHVLFAVAVTANVYHVMARLADFDKFRPLFRLQVQAPLLVGVVAMAVTFVIADAGYRPDGFSTLGGGGAWARGYWALFSALTIYLAGYVTRVLSMLRSDPRAKETVELYTVSTAFAVAAIMAILSNAWSKSDDSRLIWLCTCISVAIFAHGSARSWQAKAAWFAGAGRPVEQSNPPPPALS
ncbi:hypothetical protein A5715_17520 [Mycolicibacter heraklionensis]|nr:hypothetical protein A5715_17520 [Mycolicibacter heraklionensis]